jgi:hypothetical protein
MTHVQNAMTRSGIQFGNQKVLKQNWRTLKRARNWRAKTSKTSQSKASKGCRYGTRWKLLEPMIDLSDFSSHLQVHPKPGLQAGKHRKGVPFKGGS